MTTTKRTKWGDGGVECNLCPKDAVSVGLCDDCKILPEPRTEAKVWNDAIEAAAKWLEGLEECFCQPAEALHSNDCLVVANRVTANAMRESLLKKGNLAKERS